ncbi:MAG: TolC family protein [Bacteroidales bacterium]|nr:TolC family protein [Bacteroidales bacterium]
MKALKISSVLIIAAATAQAQQTMNLHDCLQYAMENSTKIAAANEEVNITKIDSRDGWLKAFTPSVNAYAQAQWSSGKTNDPETNMYKELKMFQEYFQVSGNMVLFDGFSAVNQIKINKIASLTGKEKCQITSDNVCLETVKAYYNYTYYSKMSAIAEKELQNASLSLQKARREYELGNKSNQDVLEKEVFEAQAQYTFADYNAQKNNALMTLKAAMFFPAEDNLLIDTTINQAVETEQLDDIAQTATFAVDHNSNIVLAKNSMDIKHIELKTARWQFLPHVEMTAGWNTTYAVLLDNRNFYPPFSDQFKNNAGKYIGINASIPIYNRLGKFSNLSRKKSNYKIASYEYEERRREIENAVYSAYDDASSAEISLTAAQKAAELNQKYYLAAQRKFEMGVISYIDFNETFNKYLESQAKYYNALFNYRLKNAVVEYYKGKPYVEQF